jgi:hypothetical protein
MSTNGLVGLALRPGLALAGARCLMGVLLGALEYPHAALAQAGFVGPSFLNGMTGPDSWLWIGTLQPDGRLLLGGQFTSFNGVPRGPVARLNVDGRWT